MEDGSFLGFPEVSRSPRIVELLKASTGDFQPDE